MPEDRERELLQSLLPLTGVVFPLLTFLDTTGETWIKIAAVSFSAIVLLVWLAVVVRPFVVRRIKQSKLKRLSESQSLRLRALLSSLDVFSCNYSRSPFHSWHELSNDTAHPARMDYRYHGAIVTWLRDLREAGAQSRRLPATYARSLSMAVLECNRLAERTGEEVQSYLQQSSLDASKETRFRKEWSSARETFNNWLRDCDRAFREVNESTGIGCPTDFSPVPPLDRD